MEYPFDEERDDRIQRALNESKKHELEEKYGAAFGPEESKALPEVESQFLQYVEQFEQQYQNARRVTIREFVGNPTFPPLKEIAGDRLESELDDVLEYLALHSVQVDFLAEVPPEERYKFVTGELLDEMTDDIRIEGMNHHFIYEEFHPNDRYDATMFAEDFLHFLLEGNVKFAMNAFCKDELLDATGARTALGAMEHGIREFTGKVMTFMNKRVECSECLVDGDYATARANVSWTALMAESLKVQTFSGTATLRLKRSPYEGWDIVQAIVPGWNA